MAQPQAARITCSLCNGLYNSERELYYHIRMAHRRSVSEQNTAQHDGTQADSVEDQLDESKEK